MHDVSAPTLPAQALALTVGGATVHLGTTIWPRATATIPSGGHPLSSRDSSHVTSADLATA